MPKKHHISSEQVKEIETQKKKNKNKKIDNRLKALLLHASGEKHSEISNKTGFAIKYISELVSKYCKQGIAAIVENHYRGNNRNLSFAKEEEMLNSFKELAEQGQIVEVSDIKKAYEKKVGRSFEKDHGIIYRLLKRHKWRKVMPRSKHPNKASEAEIEASKKLTLRSKILFMNNKKTKNSQEKFA